MIITDDMLRLKCMIIFVNSQQWLYRTKKDFLGLKFKVPLRANPVNVHDETVHQAKGKPFSLALGLLVNKV